MYNTPPKQKSVYRFDDPYARQIAADLVSIGAIKLSPEKPFTWASGWKSPIYCDNRLSLSFPEIRKAVSHHLAAIVRTKYGSADMIAGVATAGIPQGVLVADLLNLPFIYVRSSSKAHGLGNQIEGLQQPSAKVVLIEDLISTGGSSLQAATAIRQAGMEVLGMAAIFTYGFDVATQNFENHQVPLWYLSDYMTLIETMVKSGQIPEHLEATLHAWRKNPAQWGA